MKCAFKLSSRKMQGIRRREKESGVFLKNIYAVAEPTMYTFQQARPAPPPQPAPPLVVLPPSVPATDERPKKIILQKRKLEDASGLANEIIRLKKQNVELKEQTDKIEQLKKC